MAILSVLIPAYNEAAGLTLAVETVGKHLAPLGHEVRFLLIDDGSADQTWLVIEDLARKHPNVSGLGFSRNFGKEAALLAGLDACDGECVLIMDSDLQHPPDVLPKMISAWGLTNTFGKGVGPLADGILVAGTFNWNGELSPRAQKVFANIQRKFPEIKTPGDIQVPSGLANAYDSVYVITEGLKIAGAFDRTKLRDALFKVNYEGIVAKYSPAFIKGNQERMDAITTDYYKMQAFHNGILLLLEQTPYANK